MAADEEEEEEEGRGVALLALLVCTSDANNSKWFDEAASSSAISSSTSSKVYHCHLQPATSRLSLMPLSRKLFALELTFSFVPKRSKLALSDVTLSFGWRRSKKNNCLHDYRTNGLSRRLTIVTSFHIGSGQRETGAQTMVFFAEVSKEKHGETGSGRSFATTLARFLLLALRLSV